ncbi:MAG TPA: hypothetical protein VGF45_23045 [Polyangia bacterium]
MKSFQLRPSLVLTSVTVGAALVYAGVARAESAANPCWQLAEVRPLPTGSLPRNAPAILFRPPRGWSDGPVENYDLTLQESDGNVAPATARFEGDDVLLRPQRELKGGEVTLRYRNVCNTLNPMGEQRIRLDPPSQLPTSLGTIRSEAEITVAGGAACAVNTRASLVIRIDLTAEMAAYRDVARWQISYKGQTRLVDYGGLTDANRAVVQFALDDDCAGRDAVGGSVTVRAHVAGAETELEAASGTVSGRCPAPPPARNCPFDAGPDAIADAAVDVAVDRPAARDDAGSVSPPQSRPEGDVGFSVDMGAQAAAQSRSGGCAYAGASRVAPAAAVSVFSLFAFLLVRRRGRVRRHHGG